MNEPTKYAGVIRDKGQWLFLKSRYHMSLREVQVAILVCRDFENDRVAEALKIKQSTAKTHLRSIYRKTGVSSRLSLLLRFLDDIEKSGTPVRTGPVAIEPQHPRSHVFLPPRKNTRHQ
jgi:DNA-binding CsgD family transcriptional regulator